MARENSQWNNEAVIAHRFVVRGDVQGVGFRAFVKGVADKRGIKGQVWNRSDGCVEVIGSCEIEDDLTEFGLELWSGPGIVDEVRVTDEPPFKQFDSFTIERTR